MSSERIVMGFAVDAPVGSSAAECGWENMFSRSRRVAADDAGFRHLSVSELLRRQMCMLRQPGHIEFTVTVERVRVLDGGVHSRA